MELVLTGIIFTKPVYAESEKVEMVNIQVAQFDVEEEEKTTDASTMDSSEPVVARAMYTVPVEEPKEEVPLMSDVDYTYGSILMSDEEYEMFCRSIETEVTGEGHYQEKMNIAHVILNRVLDHRFPDTIEGVLTAPNQFSYSLTPDRYHSVTISETTRQVVHDIFLVGWDSTNGALYFCSGDADFSGWSNYVFTDAVGHRFYKN